MCMRDTHHVNLDFSLWIESLTGSAIIPRIVADCGVHLFWGGVFGACSIPTR